MCVLFEQKLQERAAIRSVFVLLFELGQCFALCNQMQILCLKKNAKERYKEGKITEKKEGQMGKKTAENLKGGFWWGMCDNNGVKLQSGAVCAGEDK